MEVSIIVTNYNKRPYIQESIESFLNQKTSFDYEIIAVDDCSTDGSREIIKDYCKAYPDIITGIFHDTNLGITKTWIEACNEAKGRFIARCDGDDYWTDSLKLEKQLKLLNSSPESLWCNTDFDMVNQKGELIRKNAFASSAVPVVSNFEEMLVTQGFTMSSTWLVDARLMREVNLSINPESVDDTFSIQLELFRRTTLSSLDDSCVAYRIGYISDSHIDDVEKAKKRIYGLRDTQVEYLEKYSDLDYRNISIMLANFYAYRECAHREELKNTKDVIRDLSDEADYYRNESVALNEDLLAIKNSTSWRITAPVRKVRSLLRGQ